MWKPLESEIFAGDSPLRHRDTDVTIIVAIRPSETPRTAPLALLQYDRLESAIEA